MRSAAAATAPHAMKQSPFSSYRFALPRRAALARELPKGKIGIGGNSLSSLTAVRRGGRSGGSRRGGGCGGRARAGRPALAAGGGGPGGMSRIGKSPWRLSPPAAGGNAGQGELLPHQIRNGPFLMRDHPLPSGCGFILRIDERREGGDGAPRAPRPPDPPRPPARPPEPPRPPAPRPPDPPRRGSTVREDKEFRRILIFPPASEPAEGRERPDS